MHIQVTIGSRNSAIHNAHHTSLRPSSVFEPRHPSLKVSERNKGQQVVQKENTLQARWSMVGKEAKAGGEYPQAQPPQKPTSQGRASIRCTMKFRNMCEWSFRRFTYGNLVTTSPSSKCQDSPNFPQQYSGTENCSSPNYSSGHSIGRSDGRCVQRAGT